MPQFQERELEVSTLALEILRRSGCYRVLDSNSLGQGFPLEELVLVTCTSLKAGQARLSHRTHWREFERLSRFLAVKQQVGQVA